MFQMIPKLDAFFVKVILPKALCGIESADQTENTDVYVTRAR